MNENHLFIAPYLVGHYFTHRDTTSKIVNKSSIIGWYYDVERNVPILIGRDHEGIVRTVRINECTLCD